MLNRDRVNLLRPRFTVEIAQAWEKAEDRWVFIEDTFFKPPHDRASPGLVFEIGQEFCEMLDAAFPWSKLDEMIARVLRRNFKTSAEKPEPSIGDCANAMLAVYDVLDLAGVNKRDPALGETTPDGVLNYWRAMKRKDTLRDLV